MATTQSKSRELPADFLERPFVMGAPLTRRAATVQEVPDVLTVAELAEFLRCSPATIYRLLKTNKIPAFKVGYDWRFHRATIEKWMEGK